MSIRNKAWGNLNTTRDFPFADGVGLRDDKGGRPPHEVISGLKALAPNVVGQYLYVGAMTVTSRIVTLLIMASDDLDTAGTPVLAFSQTLPLVAYRPYALEAVYPGAGGWIAFGPHIADFPYSGRFSLPRQSRLHPWAARSYQLPPIATAGLLHQTGLSGIVRLHGGNDMEIVRECREVPAYPVPEHYPQYCGDDELGTKVREVIVFRLKTPNSDGTNVFDTYRGTCSGRPESQTCDGPTPIEFLGPVAPDCHGNITLELRGCAEISAIRETVVVDDEGEEVSREGACGVIIDCGLGLSDACTTQDRLPDSEGRLPNEYDDLCVSVSYVSVSEPVVPEESFSFDTGEAAESVNPDYPIEDDLTTIGDYVIRLGEFTGDGDAMIAVNGATRNIATYEPPGDLPTGYYRRVEIEVSLAGVGSPPGVLHNAAVLANYRETSLDSGRFRYYVAEIDWDGHYRGFKLFRIAYFNGSSWVNLLSRAVPDLVLDDRYRLSLQVMPGTALNSAWLYAELVGIDDPSINLSIGPLAVNNFGPADGPFGFATNRALSSFYSFTLDNVVLPPV
jgi:hypothetical protein